MRSESDSREEKRATPELAQRRRLDADDARARLHANSCSSSSHARDHHTTTGTVCRLTNRRAVFAHRPRAQTTRKDEPTPCSPSAARKDEGSWAAPPYPLHRLFSHHPQPAPPMFRHRRQGQIFCQPLLVHATGAPWPCQLGCLTGAVQCGTREATGTRRPAWSSSA